MVGSQYGHHDVTGRPRGSVAQWSECSHGKREGLGSSPGRVMCFSSPVTAIYRNEPEWTETDTGNGPERSSEMDLNGFQWVPKRIRTAYSSYRNELQWRTRKGNFEQVGLGQVG